jgi:hypothetical protein
VTTDLTQTGLFHLHAAEGWLDLGMHVEAFDELEQIEPLHRVHPPAIDEVQNLPGSKQTRLRSHDSHRYTESNPDSPDGWFYLACALSKRREGEQAEHALKKCFITATKNGRREEVAGPRRSDERPGWIVVLQPDERLNNLRQMWMLCPRDTCCHSCCA